MADDQTDIDAAQVEADPEFVEAETVEARAHEAVAAARSDALARAKHVRDLAILEAALAARGAPAPSPTPDPVPVVAAIPDPEPTPEPVPAAAPEATPEQAPAVEVAPEPEPEHVEPEVVSEPVVEPVPEPAPPPPEPRSHRAPFASGRTKPGPRTFDAASGAVSRPLPEWLRVRGELTDAKAADGEAGGARLQALVATYGADTTWSAARPA